MIEHEEVSYIRHLSGKTINAHGVNIMPVVQCPYCDSFDVKEFKDTLYICEYCGKHFYNQEAEAFEPRFARI